MLPRDARSRSALVAASASAVERSTSVGVLAGQKIGVREVTESIWLVSFTHYDLGFLADESGCIECAPNPFVAKVWAVSIGRRNTPANLRLGGVWHEMRTAFDDYSRAAPGVLAAIPGRRVCQSVNADLNVTRTPLVLPI